jgi:alkylhydroperoxidase family enzyme
VVGIALIAAAFAQEEPCEGTLAVSEWRQALDAVEVSLGALDVDRADRILDDVVDSLRCLGEAADLEDLGRMARALAAVAYYDSDAAELASWTWLERDAVGGSWPQSFDVPAQFHVLRETLVEPPVARFDGGWAPPKNGVVWLDGRPSQAP